MFNVKDEDFKVSSWSKNNPKTCVAVAMGDKGVAVRNSNDPAKSTIFFTHEEWQAFTKGVKDGAFDKA